MRVAILAFALFLSAPAGAGSANGRPNAIEVVYAPGVMFFSIEDGGTGKAFGSGPRNFTFESSRADYVRIRNILRPIEERGMPPCADPPQGSSAIQILWRTDGVERRVAAHRYCSSDARRSVERHIDRAYETVEAMGRARWRAPPMPAPTRISVRWASWGKPVGGWSIERGGEGRYTEGDETVVFPVSAEAFDRIRAVFRPHEGTWFECSRVLTDFPYGSLTWSQAGLDDQSIHFDSGCISGDATALFDRLERAQAMVIALRGAP